MTTAHPHSFPLPWAHAHFHKITENVVKDYHVEHLMFTGRHIKPWGHSSRHSGEPFNAIFAQPNTNTADSLTVFIHDGPHEQFTSCFDTQVNTFLEMNMAVLMINYRGSTGMGDTSLESIISNIGLVSSMMNPSIYKFSSLKLFSKTI